ncbi:hypothetical protein QR685DRAFT_555588 [Neurospora intermedia]|uniref:Uncharacterized protein n=1 Tax=Neurospora intermedia TaxID=5142 RepID=A0ABR3D6W2_NEUIN
MRRAASDDWRDIEERNGGGIFNAERRGDPSGTDNVLRTYLTSHMPSTSALNRSAKKAPRHAKTDLGL